MLGFRHPRPFSRKEVAMQVVQQESKAFGATELQVDLPERPEVGPAPDDVQVRFSVAYGLGEYLSIVRDHLAYRLRRERPGKPRGRWERLAVAACVALPLTPLFYMKKRRMPVCAFRIDAEGIERTTRQGQLVRRWDEVLAVRRYRRGYLVLSAKGGMPIPFRCLNPAQQERLRALFVSRVGAPRV